MGIGTGKFLVSRCLTDVLTQMMEPSLPLESVLEDGVQEHYKIVLLSNEVRYRGVRP
jgi:hypothetical protein